MDQSTGDTSRGNLSLSNELLLPICASLSKHELKLIRQTCKSLSVCAEPFLFTTAVISTSATNIEVFEEVYQHPLFSQHVKILVYDVQEFPEVEDYDHSFIRQIINEAHFEDDTWPQEVVQDCGDEVAPFWHFNQDNNKLLPNRSVSRIYWKGKAAFNEQYQRQLSPADKRFSDVVIKGLSSLANLRDMILRTAWKTVEGFNPENSSYDENSKDQYYPGLLARRWHPLWIRPGVSPEPGRMERFLGLLFAALEHARCDLRLLDLSNSALIYGAHWECVGRKYDLALPLGSRIAKSLTTLTVEFDSISWRQTSGKDPLVQMVPPMPLLRDITVFVSPKWDYLLKGAKALSSAIVTAIANSTTFPRITTFCLKGLTISPTQLLESLCDHRNL
ncbi:MAG: hypothetical protein Q9170_006704 [Blastenia crenularia]